MGVLQDTTLAPQPPTNPPTGHLLSRQGLAKLNKNASFGPNLVVLGQKIVIFTREIKSFVTHITENPYPPSLHLFLVGHGTKWAKNANIWPKMTKNAYF